MPKLAIIQQAPVVLDRDATLKQAVRWVDAAAAAGAALIVLPESFVPCYPAWIWRLRPGPDSGLTAKLHARLVDNAVSIARGDLAPLCNAAREHKVTIVCGMTERDDDSSRGTIYNTAVVIGDDGSLRNKHRKLMPTNPERMVWGFGDGSTLNVVDSSCGGLGLIL
jgi:nitrilase